MTGGWDDPRPILVGVGSLLLVAAGAVQVVVVALVVARFGAPALILGVPIALLGAVDIMFGWRIRSGRGRGPALVAAFITLLSAPFTLGTQVLGLTTIVSSMFVIVALLRHRAWFELPPDDEPMAGGADTPETIGDVAEQPEGEASGSGRS